MGLLLTDPGGCDGEDIQCILEGLGITGLIAALGAPVGTFLAGHGAGVTFTLSHGVVTALGSRWLAALR